MSEHDKPVAWGWMHNDGVIYDCITPGEHDRVQGEYTTPLYTHPPQSDLAIAEAYRCGAELAKRSWVGLTDEEIDRVTDQQWAKNNNKPLYAAHRAYARAIEAVLREKNT